MMKLIPRSLFPDHSTARAARLAMDHPVTGDKTIAIVVYGYVDPEDPFGAPIEIDPMLGFISEEEMRASSNTQALNINKGGYLCVKALSPRTKA